MGSRITWVGGVVWIALALLAGFALGRWQIETWIDQRSSSSLRASSAEADRLAKDGGADLEAIARQMAADRAFVGYIADVLGPADATPDRPPISRLRTRELSP